MYNGTKINKRNSFIDEILKAVILAHYLVQNFILTALKFILFGPKKNIEAKRILIFRTGSLGDSVCALPAIYSIRKNFPDAQIDILTNAGAENLVSLGALIDRSIINEIINYFGLSKKDLFKNLKEKKYDLFIQLPQYDSGILRQIRDIFIAKSLGVKYAFGWQVASTWFMAKQQARLIKFENERDRLLRILEKNGLRSYGLIFPLGITSEIESGIAEVVKMRRLEDKSLNVGMVVGAKRPQNRWPIEYFKEVAEYLLKQNKNILLFGGPGDFELAEQIRGDNVFNFCGKLTPLETAEMMKYCQLVISNDTGPMHLAYSVNITVVAIFSGRDYPGKWHPLKDNLTFRLEAIICFNCLNKCKKNNKCLRDIKPLKIIEILNATLN